MHLGACLEPPDARAACVRACVRPQEVMRAPIPTSDWLRMRKALPRELRDKVSEFDQNKAARHPQNLLQIAMQAPRPAGRSLRRLAMQAPRPAGRSLRRRVRVARASADGGLLVMPRRVFVLRIPCWPLRVVLACCMLHAERCIVALVNVAMLQQALQHQSERLAEYRAQLGEEVRPWQPAVLGVLPLG
jgi:hypothetical protein